MDYQQQQQQYLKQGESVLLWQIWPGTNRWCCRGIFMTGPWDDCCQNTYTWGCILLVGIPYMIFLVPDLYLKFHPLLPVANVFLLAMTMFFLILTSCTDPGIIPRKKILELNPNAPVIFLTGTVSNEGIENIDNNPVNVVQNTNNFSNYYEDQSLKFCTTCQIYRPSRASHCSDCNNCVEVFDHHCPFVNNCIGQRNYRYFVSFLFSVCFLSISLVAGLLTWLIAVNGKGNKDPSSMDSTTIILLVIFAIPVGLLGLAILGLTCFHLILIISGKTTREQLKKLSSSSEDEKVNWFTLDPPLFNPRQRLNTIQANNIIKNQ